MPKQIEIRCDACCADLTTTGNCEDYRLALLVQAVSPRSDLVTAMSVYPPLDRDAYFCGIGCLRDWLASK